jgi:hypothetical protein
VKWLTISALQVALPCPTQAGTRYSMVYSIIWNYSGIAAQRDLLMTIKKPVLSNRLSHKNDSKKFIVSLSASLGRRGPTSKNYGVVKLRKKMFGIITSDDIFFCVKNKYFLPSYYFFS